MHLGDGPGNAKVADVCHSSAYDACRLCFSRQEQLWDKKKYFCEDFRSFLPQDYRFLQDRRFTPIMWTQARPAPKTDTFMRFTGEVMAEINRNLPPEQEMLHSHGVKCMHVFAECKNFDTVRDTGLDIFHLSKNWWEAFIKLTAISDKGKTKLYVPVPKFREPKRKAGEIDSKFLQRVQEHEENHDAKVRLIQANNRSSTLFGSTREEQKLIDRRYASVLAPRGWKGSGLPYAKGASMKTADCMFFIKFCSSWIFSGIFTGPQLKCLTLLFSTMRSLLGWKVVADDIDWLEETIWENLVETSLLLPSSIRNLWWHYIGHYPQQMRDWGSPLSQSTARVERRVGGAVEMSRTFRESEITISRKFARHNPFHANIHEAKQEINEGVLGPRVARYSAQDNSIHNFFLIAGESAGNYIRAQSGGGEQPARIFKPSGEVKHDINLFLREHPTSSISWESTSEFKIDVYRQSYIQGHMMSCADAERISNCRASFFETVPGIHSFSPHALAGLGKDFTLIGRVERYLRVLLKSSDCFNWVEIAQVRLFKWSAPSRDAQEPEYSIDTGKGTYSLRFLPLQLIQHLTILAPCPVNHRGERRYHVLPVD
eukprot:g25379.t1